MRDELIEYVWERLETLKELFPNIAFEKLKSIKSSGDKGEFWGQMRLVGELKPEIENTLSELYEFDYDRNIERLEKELASVLETNGEDSSEVAAIYNNLGVTYKSKGEYDKAIECHEKAIGIALKTLGENHPNTAIHYSNLGSVYNSKEEYDEAVKYLEKALEIDLKTLGENHPYTAIRYSNLGETYRSKEEYDKAFEYLEKAIEIDLKTIGEKHPSVAIHYSNLGSVYNSKEEYDKAIGYYKKALNIDLKTIGENNPSTAIRYNNLGFTYYLKGNYAKAIYYYEKAIDIDLKTIGENNAQTARHLDNLGWAYDLIWEYDKAIECFAKALSISAQLPYPPTIAKDHYLERTKALSADDKPFFVDYEKCKINVHIIKAHIKNFKLLEDVTVELSSGINIFIGENSSGKTSLLQALTLALLPEKYPGEPSEKYESYISKGQSVSEVSAWIDGYEKKLTLRWNERELKNKLLTPFILAYGSNIFTKETEGRVEDFVDDIASQKIRKEFVDSIFEEYTDKLYNPKSLLNKLNEYSDENKKKSAKILMDTINKFVDDFKIELDEKRNRYFFRHNSQKLFRLEELSEGYRNTVVLLGDMVAKILGVGKTPATIEGIIIIDEFDRHLHPKWQANLVDKLAEIFPKIQFLLTTHNPMSILGRKPEEITVLYEEDGKIKARRDIGTENIDVGTALLKYFGVDSLVGVSMQNKIERFTELKLKDSLAPSEEDELSKLEETLEDTVATNFIYNRAYFEFLKFLKNNEDIELREYEKLDDSQMAELMEKYKDLL